MTVLRWMCLIAVLFVAAACSETNKDQCKLPEDCPGGFDCVDGKCVNTGLNDSDETADATDTESGLPDKENGLPDSTDGLPDDGDIAPDGDTLPDGDTDSTDVTPDTDTDEPADTEVPETDEPLIDDSDDDLLGDGEIPDDDGEQPEAEVEWPDVDTDVQICTPNQVQTCVYTGDPGTQNVGPCKAGSKQCNAQGTAWSNCTGEVIPSSDVCTDIIDNDCNGTVNDGYSTGATGCVCLPGGATSCYTGPGGTEGVGECHAGTKTCGTYGNNWGNCTDQTIPLTEICGNGLNDDCVGGADDGLDADGDGWSTCAGDCCDSTAQCQNPELVNPGAVEVAGGINNIDNDGVDNDCNGSIDDVPTPCSTAQKFSGLGPVDLLNAMGICKTAANSSWGIVGTPTVTRADGEAVLCSNISPATCSSSLSIGQSSADLQTAVMAQFGSDPSNASIEGDTMAAFSSGRARDNFNDPDPTGAVTYRYDLGQPPSDFVAAHGGSLPTTSVGCPASTGVNPSNDSVMLSVQLKVPTNANSFSFSFRFFSQEYWSYTCQAYNDFFVTLLDTSWTPSLGEQPIPADKNISFDTNGSYISVNSTNFFTVCNAKTGYTCPDGTSALSDTGYAPANAGATKWLATSAPVVPGETITLRFVIWDTSDTTMDSLVLIDNFKWSAEASGGPVTFACWDLNQNGNCDVATEDLSGDDICNERDC